VAANPIAAQLGREMADAGRIGQNFLVESPLQPYAVGLGFALFLTPRLRDGGGGYCGRRTIKTLILWQLEFE
jgi:hypothetical protein